MELPAGLSVETDNCKARLYMLYINSGGAAVREKVRSKNVSAYNSYYILKDLTKAEQQRKLLDCGCKNMLELSSDRDLNYLIIRFWLSRMAVIDSIEKKTGAGRSRKQAMKAVLQEGILFKYYGEEQAEGGRAENIGLREPDNQPVTLPFVESQAEIITICRELQRLVGSNATEGNVNEQIGVKLGELKSCLEKTQFKVRFLYNKPKHIRQIIKDISDAEACSFVSPQLCVAGIIGTLLNRGKNRRRDENTETLYTQMLGALDTEAGSANANGFG